MKPVYRSLCLALTGATAASLHAQVLSQRQLNGFLIGQHRDAIAASFSTVLRVDTTSDGWLNRTYLWDKTHHAYMSFKFPSDKPDSTVSVQIAGASGPSLTPFLGTAPATPQDHPLPRPGNP